MRNLDDVFARLATSSFRRKFHLAPTKREYLREKGLVAVLDHAGTFIATRLGPANPVNDGKQTPWRGHPVFVAQHATVTSRGESRSVARAWFSLSTTMPRFCLDEEECFFFSPLPPLFFFPAPRLPR